MLEELLAFAKSLVPRYVDLTLSESDQHFALGFRIGSMHLGLSAVGKTYGIRELTDPQERKTHLRFMKERIEERIQEFRLSLLDAVVRDFELEDYLRESFSDPNIIYKVPRLVIRHRGKVKSTANLGFTIWSELTQETVPSLFNLWNKVADDTFYTALKAKYVLDYAHSTLVKLKELRFAEYIIGKLLDLEPGNDIQFLLGYHFTKFVSLIKSICDNVAWLIKIVWDLEEERGKLDFTSKEFRKSLAKHAPRVHEIIYSHPRYVKYKQFVSLRDMLIHRHHLHVVPVMIRNTRQKENGITKYLIPKEPENMLLSTAKEEGRVVKQDRQSMAKYGHWVIIIHLGPKRLMDKQFHEPKRFCRLYKEFVVDVVEETAKQILLENISK